MTKTSTIKSQRQQESDRTLTQLKETVPSILARYPVDAAYVYGSVARGTMLPFSDVDIALLLSEELSPYERLKLELTIQGDIEAASNLHPVDVRSINEAPLLVQGRVVQEGILFHEGDRARRVAFEVATRKRYFDFAPVARRLQESFLHKVHQEGLSYGRSRNPGHDSQ
jgi:predicted nucleotidyltransferase